ncbi:hypothetical protein BJ322DRAFT_130884 [Thelephora terrestris]|uniref:Uncharacterized protein n=1 Tax=Thelephora terrestris TaxID=56493 RepID=A0A9P6LCJ4_9AGAM|nr:hypothetical protein BJ322DRAFT_130884 [Thelephora terrestris]
MFHVRKLSNTLSSPVVFSPKPTNTSDTMSNPNHPFPSPTAKPPKTSTRPFHRRARPSIDKSQVSKPFPILTYDEKELFDVIASGSMETRERRIPKVAEKKVNVNPPESIESTPQRKPKVPADTPSRSWYTPAIVQSSPKGGLHRSASTATPRTAPYKVDVGRTNSTKESRSRGRAESKTQRDEIETAKRPIDKQSISHPDCPWIDPSNAPNSYGTQHRPVRSATMGSCESDETAVEDRAPTGANVLKKRPTLAKPVEDTLRPTVKLVSKPLPDLPVTDSVSSRWSTSTGSVYSDDRPFSYDHVLGMFPRPPEIILNVADSDDWEHPALSTPPVFMSRSNSSSSSVATVVPVTTPDPPTVKPLTLKAVPKPKVATVVYQNPRASCSFSQLPDSIAVHRARACPQASVKGSIHASVRTVSPAPTLRRRLSSFSSSNSKTPPNRIANIEALVWPHLRQTPKEIERIESERLERYRQYELEQEKEQELRQFETEFGINPWYQGKKSYEREVDPNGFELIRPEKKPRKWL